MKVVVVHILTQSFRHSPVALISVHDSGENILLTTHDLHSCFVCVGVKLFGIFIAAVIVEVSGVHIENQFPVFYRIGLQATGGDNAIGNHLIEHGSIANIARGIEQHGLGDGGGMLFGMNLAQAMDPLTAAAAGHQPTVAADCNSDNRPSDAGTGSSDEHRTTDRCGEET